MTDRLQYLESFDSTRSPWIERERRELSDLQVLLEVVLTLALGRQVVVPQPYALDSLGFLRAADTVLHARDLARSQNREGPQDAPFRLHLYDANTFEEAATKMLARVSDPARPFYSSMMPELNDPTNDPEVVRGQTAGLDALLSTDWIGYERAGLINRIRAEFRASPRAPRSANGSRPGLKDIVLNFLHGSEAQTFPSASSQAARDVLEELRIAIGQLDPGRSGTFEQRSRIHLRMPWLGDPERRTPEEIVGSARLKLVQEFLDTLYNRIVAASIDAHTRAVFTTPALSAAEPLVARAIAQDLALSAYGGLDGLEHAGSSGRDFEPTFQVLALNASEADVSEGVEKIRTDLITGLPGLMEARADRGGGRRKRSDFWQGIDRFNDKVASGETVAARVQLEKHLELVSRLLAGGVTTSTKVKWMETATAGVSSAGTTIAAGVALPGSLLASGIAAGIGAVVSAGIGPTAGYVERRGRRRRLTEALGRVIDVRGAGA
jgi:hypothetical protein